MRKTVLTLIGGMSLCAAVGLLSGTATAAPVGALGPATAASGASKGLVEVRWRRWDRVYGPRWIAPRWVAPRWYGVYGPPVVYYPPTVMYYPVPVARYYAPPVIIEDEVEAYDISPYRYYRSRYGRW